MKKQEKKVSPRKSIKKYIAKPVAYATVIVLASYGMRMVLKNIDETANIVITTLSVLALTYIMFDTD